MCIIIIIIIIIIILRLDFYRCWHVSSFKLKAVDECWSGKCPEGVAMTYFKAPSKHILDGS